MQNQDEFNLRCTGNTTQNEMKKCGGDGTPANRDYSRPQSNYYENYSNSYNQNLNVERKVRELNQIMEQMQMMQAQPVESGGIAKRLKWANNRIKEID